MIPSQPQSGTIQGQSIQLDQPSGLADGTKVVVEIQPAVDKKPEAKGILSTAGFWDVFGLFADLSEIFSD